MRVCWSEKCVDCKVVGVCVCVCVCVHLLAYEVKSSVAIR